MLLEPETAHYIAKILRLAEKLGVIPLRFHETKMQIFMTKKLARFKCLWSLNFFCGIFGMAKFGVILYIVSVLYNKGEVGLSYWLFWNIVFLMSPAKLWLGTLYLQQREEIQYNVNCGLQIMGLISARHEHTWTNAEHQRDKKIWRLFTYTFKLAYYTTFYFEPSMFCVAGPIWYWDEILKTGVPFRHFVLTEMGIMLPPGPTELLFTILYIGIIFSVILHLNLFLIIITAKLAAAYWVLEMKLGRAIDAHCDMERPKSFTEDRLSYLPNSLRIYGLVYVLVNAIVRLYSMFTAFLIGMGISMCSILLYLMSSKVATVTERIVAGGTFFTLVILATFMQSMAGRVYSHSISLIASWSREGKTGHALLSSQSWKDRRRLLRGIRPLQVVAGGSYFVDQLQELRFFDTVIDKTILIWEMFPQ